MSRSRGVATAVIVLGLFVGTLGAGAATAKPAYRAYASCGSGKPSKPAHHCTFGGPDARATFLFESNGGKRTLTVCQRIYGLSFHGRQCLKAKQPTARDVIPFVLHHPGGPFRLVVTFYAKKPAAAGKAKQVARVALRFSPS